MPCPQCNQDDQTYEVTPGGEYPFACKRCECFFTAFGKVLEPLQVDDGWSDLFTAPTVENPERAKQPMGDRQTQGPGTVPASGQLTIQMFIMKARYGVDVVMELRSLRYNFGQVAEILGEAVPESVVQEPDLEKAKALVMGLLVVKCARLLKQRGWDMDRLIARAKELDEADGATA